MTSLPQDVQATFCATLVDQWLRHGLRDAIIAPGSRSTPMALALASRPELAVHIFHDERSAAFAALGAALSSAVPAALLCTSGTAATHFHAAVVEAHQSGVPMLVLTANRPPELHGVGAPQTINQTNLYGDSVRWFHDPGVANDDQRGTWRWIASTAWSMAIGALPGPVHLDLPFREPLVGVVGELPDVAVFDLLSAAPAVIEPLVELLGEARGVIVAGAGVDDPAAVAGLSAASGWPVLADPLSGCQTVANAVVRFDALLRHGAFAAAHRPAAVLQLGMPPASKVLGQWLAASGAAHIAVSPVGLLSDPNVVGAMQIHAPIGQLCAALSETVAARDAQWLDGWLCADRIARDVVESALDAQPDLSEPGIARAVTAAIPSGGHLVVASSMPVRDVEWFGTLRNDITVHANRGANGIDGVIATAIGVAIGSGAPTTVLLGDVAFCHDSSSLTALARRGLHLKIIVTDNDGGAIFSFLPQAATLSPAQFEQLFGTPHGTDIIAVARAHGLRAYDADTATELQAAFDEPDTCVVRIASSRAANVAVHAALNGAVIAALS